MDSDLQMQPQANADSKTAFRKPLSDAASRKYRRHSPVGGSSSSDGSPKHGHKGSPPSLSEDPAKVLENRQRTKDYMRELDKHSGRSHYGRAAYSHRHSDRHSSRSSHGYSKHDDNIRYDKCEDDGEKDNYRLTSHIGRESRGSIRSDYRRQDSEYGKSRDSGDRYSRDRYEYDSSGYRYREKDSSYEKEKYKDKDSSADRGSSGRRHSGSNSEKERELHRRDGRNEKRDYYRRSGNYKSDRTFPYDESREHGIERDRYKEGRKETESQNLVKEERKMRDEREANSDKDGHDKASGEKGENRFTFATENRESSAKKPKLFSSDKATDNATVAVMESSSSKQTCEIDGEAQRQARANVAEAATDLDAAKFAAMKAAESVNKNLVGLGVLSTDQKKKLLWGSKKNANAEESAHCWDAPLFGDRERQEKFNKLMGVKGDLKVEHKPDNQEGGGLLQAEKQKELQLDLEKQYTAGLRRRDGRTVGLGL